MNFLKFLTEFIILSNCSPNSSFCQIPYQIRHLVKFLIKFVILSNSLPKSVILLNSLPNSSFWRANTYPWKNPQNEIMEWDYMFFFSATTGSFCKQITSLTKVHFVKIPYQIRHFVKFLTKFDMLSNSLLFYVHNAKMLCVYVHVCVCTILCTKCEKYLMLWGENLICGFWKLNFYENPVLGYKKWSKINFENIFHILLIRNIISVWFFVFQKNPKAWFYSFFFTNAFLDFLDFF